MASLAEIQTIFSNAVIDVDQPYPPSIKRVGSSANTKTRFDVYRNNVFVALIDMIKARFLVVQRLVGEEFFRGVARSYARAHPPGTHPSLYYGATFPDFLKSFPPVADLPYLPDVAALEWACHEARFASDQPVISIENAQKRLSQSSDATPSIKLHTAAYCVTSRFPIHTIWETNTHDEEVKKVNLGDGGQDVLVTRPHYEVQVACLPTGGAKFVESTKDGNNIVDAFEAAMEENPNLDLQTLLVSMLHAGAIADISN